MDKIYTVFNVLIKGQNGSDDDICLHRSLKGAEECQSKRGGVIVEEEADSEVYQECED